MAKQFSDIQPNLCDFILSQHIFFTASAASTGRVNLSPKDGRSLRVLNQSKVIYLDATGSGNETAAHLHVDGRLTLMFCAFEGQPMILRLYGQGRVLKQGGSEYQNLLEAEYAGRERVGARQMILLNIDLVKTSCGFGVPLFNYAAERPALDRWAKAKGEAGLENYRRLKNAHSMDGFPTGMFEDP